jgi:hypothetical protein
LPWTNAPHPLEVSTALVLTVLLELAEHGNTLAGTAAPCIENDASYRFAAAGNLTALASAACSCASIVNYF